MHQVRATHDNAVQSEPRKHQDQDQDQDQDCLIIAGATEICDAKLVFLRKRDH